MARIPENVINDIRNKSDIVDVISHYMPLDKKGKNYAGVCPFHDDHDPSMSVHVDKQIYRCFACGAGGNVFTFVQNYENVGFVEAVKRVAEIENIPFDYDVGSSVPKVDPAKKALYNVLNDAIEFTSYELKSQEGKPFYEYLKSRNINDAILEKFQIGYNPINDKLYHFLHAKKHSDEDIIKTGVVRLTQQGLRDVFYHRFMIPIHDSYGNPVGFTARIIDASSDAKYINTSDTPIYSKGHLLFNYHRAKDEARKSGIIYVVEGAMDVLALEKAGITNGVATLGTAATDSQCKLIRYTNAKVYLFYDGDKAGQEATYKFGLLSQKQGLQVEVVKNELGLDPDEIIETYGIEELQSICKKTISWIEFMMNYLAKKFNLANYSEKKEYAKLVGEQIAKLKDDFEKENYYSLLQEYSGFDLRNMNQQPQTPTQTIVENTNVLRKPQPGIEVAQYHILSQLLLAKQAGEIFRHELGFLPTDAYNQLALAMINHYREHDTIEVADLLNALEEKEMKELLLHVVDWKLAYPEYSDVLLRDSIKKIKRCMMDEKIKNLRQQATELSDPKQKANIAVEIAKLKREKGDY
ncbi:MULTISPECIES: DNA primase [unclassified Breznakia]|uniref:DNA primase n=1 Tax=unclassified Breznakia TaxID=2623764 RepID=UPI0024754F07|nr:MULTISPECIES: DNA primase [unclassified Breznakia]MDH6366773.1 DNA primase [Breznakia sp. PH1-1]MDH6403840.1 DNA primase [Breznakia sp. PF1-11]MDH6411549.1 DNA primase [Breznakia sp. PFB1-11]MDH6413913.1 DNA primase [Breznakia sp. PFB1-14]MDH6416342.1 DNA primase [Breznakia sp. PFB1-4]